jgi:2-polyprenyl-6-methoxyphenol hydroxylase-like FAD-dependent oxidoreductase
MLASELALAGVRALVLKRRDDIDPTIKAGSINVATLEAFYRRGLLPAIRAEQERIAAFMRRGPAGGGHRRKPLGARTRGSRRRRPAPLVR